MRGGFLRRVREGTLLGHVTEHVAIELQTLAGMDVAYGKTRSTTERGVYNVVFRFFDELAGVYAGKAAVKCDLCSHYKKYPSEFEYKATEYVRDCDPFYAMICADCVANKPQEVIRLLADADDIETVKSS